ncbi:MAG: hypothetical protein H0V22_02645 [Solirubrobacterales bacterium]|nr:hypothetical protein [Solirubrobacterales bacterium]
MINTTRIHPIRSIVGAAVAALLCIVALSPSAGQAAGKTETLRFFSKPMSFTHTTADGTVSHRPPAGPPQAGDVLEIDSLDYAGTHRRHAKRPKGSDRAAPSVAAPSPIAPATRRSAARCCGSAAWKWLAPSDAGRAARCSATRKSKAAPISSSSSAGADHGSRIADFGR